MAFPTVETFRTIGYYTPEGLAFIKRDARPRLEFLIADKGCQPIPGVEVEAEEVVVDPEPPIGIEYRLTLAHTRR